MAFRKCMYCGYHILNCYCEDEKNKYIPTLKPEPVPVFEEAQAQAGTVVTPSTTDEAVQAANMDTDNNSVASSLTEHTYMSETPFVGGDEPPAQPPRDGLDDLIDMWPDPDAAPPEDTTTTPKRCIQICEDPSSKKPKVEEGFPNKRCCIRGDQEDYPPGNGWDDNPEQESDQNSVRDTDPPPTDAVDNEQPPGTPPPPSPPPEPVITLHSMVRKDNIGGNLAVDEQTDSFPNHGPVPNWLPAGAWDNAIWDGVPFDPCEMPCDDLHEALFPNDNTMRGLKQLYDYLDPFADEANPTVPEIEAWNLEVIRHFRRLLGFSEATHPIDNDRDLFIKAQWATERKFTRAWDTMYPGEFNSAYGPCGGSNAHCGASFVPSAADQIPYLIPGQNTLEFTGGGAEGIGTVNTNIPWALKMSRIIGAFLDQDCITGHTGPFIGRRYVGYAWHVMGATTEFRVKWSGPLAEVCPEPPPPPPPHVHDVQNVLTTSYATPISNNIMTKGSNTVKTYNNWFDVGKVNRIGPYGGTGTTLYTNFTLMASNDCLGHPHKLRFKMERKQGQGAAVTAVWTAKGVSYNTSLMLNTIAQFEFDVIVDQPVEVIPFSIQSAHSGFQNQWLIHDVEYYVRPDISFVKFDTPITIAAEFQIPTVDYTIVSNSFTTDAGDSLLQMIGPVITFDVSRLWSGAKYIYVDYSGVLLIEHPDFSTTRTTLNSNTTYQHVTRHIIPVTETSGVLRIGGNGANNCLLRQIGYYTQL